ncbi:MAG: dipeptidase [Deltaproteobacteria bacterium]|nr:dipeptidase [Deltaproteobacteria bacterium]
MSNLQALNELFEIHQEEILKDYFTLLKFKSISSEMEYKGEMLACASWLRDYFTQADFAVELIETISNPLVLASWDKAGTDKPTLLVYGHYDVQPVDPLELWQTPPFEPTICTGQVFARGANDDKGQFFFAVSAITTLLKQNRTLPINIKIVLEGDEETGSNGLEDIIPKIADKLKADYLAIIDVGLKNENQPSITIGTRGIVSLTFELTEGNTDLHSGTFGGIAYNPNRALAEILASFYDKNGRVLVNGFYDDVVMPSPTELALLDISLNTDELKREYDLDCTGGEQEFKLEERKVLRPTLEINGMSGGYSGSGFKTVIPQKALAKISARLVPKQEGSKIVTAICEHIKARVPAGIKCNIIVHDNRGQAFRSNPQSKICRVCSQAFADVNGTTCATVLDAAAIPIAPTLAKYSGAETVLIGYGLDSDKIHAPNEHFGLDRFKAGFITIGEIVELLG